MASKAVLAVALLLCCATAALATKCYSDGDCKTSKPCEYGKCSYGNCVYKKRPDGYACNDGNPCTIGDKCSYGVCTPGAAKKCVSKNQCKTSTCNTYSGNCEESNKPEGTPCNDGKKCTIKDKCSYGQCVGTLKSCPTTKPCTKSYCNPMTGECKTENLPDGTPCNDGNPKTEKDKCTYGVCKGTPIYYG